MALTDEEIINVIIKKALNEEDTEEAINGLLSDFGRVVDADRAYIFEIHKDASVMNTHEWCRAGVSPQKQNLQSVPFSVFGKTWKKILEENDLIIIPDLEAYKEQDPDVYEMLKEQQVQRLICAPLFVDQTMIGFFGVDNPNMQDEARAAALVRMISSFVAVLVRHKKNVQRIEELSQRDLVTGTYNMMYFLNAMKKEIQEGHAGHTLEKTRIIYFNIRHFKLFNDAYGIEEGNKCLQKLARMLMYVFETENVSRFGADHFVVFYFKNDYAEKIREAHDRCLTLDTRSSLWLTAGISKPTDAEKLERFCDYGKIACDNVREDGIQFCRAYDEALGQELILKKYVQDHIDEALRKGFIKVYYQPVVRSVTGRLCGFEALTRWDDPEHGMLSPAVFIPALEEVHLCYKIDFYVAEQVCRDLRSRMDAGLSVVPISVNLSRRDFTVTDPVAEIETIVEKYRVDHFYLCVEITESAVMEEPAVIREAMDRFHSKGFQVWMDDFGSAYSSLNTLKDFPFDEIKIDMGFVRNMNQNSRVIIADVVHMAKALGIHSLCEGVEEKEQLDFLREIGCERIQGYYYGAPMPPEKQLKNLENKGIAFETREESRIANSAGLAQFSQTESFCLVWNDGSSLQTIYANKPFMRLLLQDPDEENPNMARIDQVLNDHRISFGRLMHHTAEEAAEGKEEVKLFATINSQSLMFICTRVAGQENGCVEKLVCVDITDHEDDEKYAYALRCVSDAYDEIYLVSGDEGVMEIVSSMVPGEKTGGKVRLTDGQLFREILPEEKEAFLKTMTTEYRKAAIGKAGRESYTENFHIRKAEDGVVYNKSFTTIEISYRGKHEYLLCIKPAAI